MQSRRHDQNDNDVDDDDVDVDGDDDDEIRHDDRGDADMRTLRSSALVDHSGLRLLLVEPESPTLLETMPTTSTSSSQQRIQGDATLVARLDDVFQMLQLVAQPPTNADPDDLSAALLPADAELDSMSVDQLRAAMRRNREIVARCATTHELELHAARRRHEWLTHQIRQLFDQCRHLPAFAEQADLDFAAAIGDDPLRFLKSIALTTFRLNRDLLAAKQVVASLEEHNATLVSQLDELKLRLVEEFNKVAGVPSPIVYAKRAAGRQLRRSQSNAADHPRSASAATDAAVPSVSPTTTTATTTTSKLATPSVLPLVGKASSTSALDMSSSSSDAVTSSGSRSQQQRRSSRDPGAPLAPTGHVAGQLEYSVVKRRVTLVQARVRGWLVRRRMRALRIRMLVLRELIQTEVTYVADLRALVQVYMRPLLNADARGKPIVPREDVRNLFSSIEVMYLYNESFLAELQHQRTMAAAADFPVGKAFLLLGDFMRTYVPYCNNYNVALAALDRCGQVSAFRQFVRHAVQLYPCQLPSLLIKPVQRLPRYVLLLKQLCECTPATHADSKPLELALVKMLAITNQLNEAKREAEAFAEVVRIFNSIAPRDREGVQELIAPSRRFVKEGRVFYRRDESATNDAAHYLFLFNDLLLVTVPSARGFHSVAIALTLANVTSVVPLLDSDTVQHCFILDTPNRTIMLLAESAADRDEWVRALQSAIQSLPAPRPQVQ
jgi:hypothetical protein